MPVINHATLKEFSQQIFIAAKSDPEEAEIVSDHLVRSNLCGVDSHGVIRIPEYLTMIENGKIKPNVKPSLVRETKATATIDARFGFGQVAGKLAMEMAIKKAEDYGIGAVTVQHCNHTGRIGEYPPMACERNMVGLFMAKAYPCIVPPWGGSSRVLSTSPLSFAIPAGQEKSIVGDFATSVSSEGKIRVKLNRGEKLPGGWILDVHGRATKDPAELYRGGTILPFGQHKGYALNLLVEALGGALTGGGVADEFSGANGVFAQAVNVSFFVPINEFKANIDKLIRKMKKSFPAEGFSQILLPGEPEFLETEERLKNGIMIDEKTWEQILGGAGRYGVSPPRP